MPEPFLLSSLDDGWLHRRALSVSLLRLDLLHPVASGNKWFKLRHNLELALQQGCKGVATFGGPFSNHLAATAGAAQEQGLRSLGFVRGRVVDTDTLRWCRAAGMQLEFLSREEYARKDEDAFRGILQSRFPAYCFIPEGGANEPGRKGAEAIAPHLPPDATHVCVSVGTGTTLTGLRNALPGSVAMMGFVPMKGGAYLEKDIRQHLMPGQDCHWSLTDDWHFGGFGKTTRPLLDFMVAFYNHYRIPLDIVYTGKMLYGLRNLLAQGHFPDGSRLVAIHTGGLQGNPASLKALFAGTGSD